MLRSWFLFHVASGQAFFSGAALIILVVALSPWARARGLRPLQNLCVLFGVVLVAISATPLPWWAWAGLGVLTVAWLLVARRQRRSSHAFRPPAAESNAAAASGVPGENVAQGGGPSKHLVVARIGVVAAWLSAAAVEARWHITPRVPPLERPVLAVIGDSVTAGMGEDEAVTWPRRLAAEHSVAIDDFSRMGATVASARQQAARLRSDHNLVLLEIGGNDLLGASSLAEFASGMQELLDDVCRPGRTVLMFELPLPPSYNRYGCVQRDLARDRGVLLIPKRVLMSVLCRNDTTLDSIHLSQAGHDELADAVWSIARTAYGPAD